MSFATLMVYVEPNYTRERIVRIAAQLADRFTSKLIGVSAMPIRPPVIANGIIVNAITDAEIDQMTSKLQEKESWFRQIAGDSRHAIDWRSELDFPTEFLISQARCADLIVVNQNREILGAYDALDAAGVILKAGRPVLVAPGETQTVQADRVVIGWKDSREARRAVMDALPFLHEATRVTIAAICEEGDEKSVERSIDDVAQYLARHRIKAGPKVFLHREGSNATRLIQLAQDEGADLLVTGAYGHSRLGEWVFGGVTQELLATSPICCLMSH
jgi:nucleotide-binding universal stress UspA family protein